MKKILLIVLLVALVAFSGCTISEPKSDYERFREQIEEANYCTVDEDCAAVSFGCDFADYNFGKDRFAHSYVHVEEAAYLQDFVLREYRNSGHCSSTPPALPVCQEGKCKPTMCEIGKEYDYFASDPRHYLYFEPAVYKTCKCPEDTILVHVCSDENCNNPLFKCDDSRSKIEIMNDTCKQLDSPDQRDNCYFDLALERKDIQICPKIVNQTNNVLLERCYRKIAETLGDSSICEEITTNIYEKALCYQEVATATEDRTICQKIEQDSYRDTCYDRLARATKNESICDLIEHEGSRQVCHTNVARENENR
ncbi:MAG: hypothetical protein JW772_01465 [Candidatus Diapherotrites archaeon]|nr:hypothetical protein [Candidatus Diapherotrites archaeon]